MTVQKCNYSKYGNAKCSDQSYLLHWGYDLGVKFHWDHDHNIEPTPLSRRTFKMRMLFVYDKRRVRDAHGHLTWRHTVTWRDVTWSPDVTSHHAPEPHDNCNTGAYSSNPTTQMGARAKSITVIIFCFEMKWVRLALMEGVIYKIKVRESVDCSAFSWLIVIELLLEPVGKDC